MSLVSGTNYNVEIIGGPRNVIINGNFNIWQRGTSFVTPTPNDFTADRMMYSNVGTMTHTIARSTDVPTYAESGVHSNFSLLADCTTADASIAAGDYTFIKYTVEGYDYAKIAGGDATLSFWVKGAKTGIHCVGFRNAGFDRSYVAEYTIVAANTWEKKTITVPMTETAGTWDYESGKGIQIDFTLVGGTTFQTTKDTWQVGSYFSTASQVNEVDNVANNFHIAQVQLEKGDVATPFTEELFADELARCQRYYWRGNIKDSDGVRYGAVSSTMMAGSQTLHMRDTPVGAIITAPNYANCSAAVVFNNKDTLLLTVTVTILGNYRAHSGVYEANAEF